MNHQTDTIDMKVAGSASTRVALADLKVDTGYVRPLDEARVDEMARDFIEALLATVVVNRRPNGDLYVVDGQHRVAAVRTSHPTATHAWVHVIEVPEAAESALSLMYNDEDFDPDELKVLLGE